MSSEFSRQLHLLVKSFDHLKATDKTTASALIKNELLTNKPSMIARFGSNEIKAVLYPKRSLFFKVILKKMMNYNPKSKEFVNMKVCAGFFSF